MGLLVINVFDAVGGRELPALGNEIFDYFVCFILGDGNDVA